VAEDKGGLGLPVTREVSISEHHRRIAAFLVCQDDESIRLSRRRGWLFQPGPEFSSAARREEEEILDELRVPFIRVLKSEAQPDDPLFPTLIRSNLMRGLDPDEVDDESFLSSWFRQYRTWSKKCQKTRGNLTPMTTANSVLPADFTYRRQTEGMMVMTSKQKIAQKWPATQKLTRYTSQDRTSEVLKELFEVFGDWVGDGYNWHDVQERNPDGFNWHEMCKLNHSKITA